MPIPCLIKIFCKHSFIQNKLYYKRFNNDESYSKFIKNCKINFYYLNTTAYALVRGDTNLLLNLLHNKSSISYVAQECIVVGQTNAAK